MRNECNIIRELLPLYWEGMVSEDTEAYVKEHLEGCAECAKLNAQTEPEEAAPVSEEELPVEEHPEENPDIMALKKVKKKIQKKKMIAIVISVILTVAVIFICVDFTPTKIDYGNSRIYSRQEM